MGSYLYCASGSLLSSSTEQQCWPGAAASFPGSAVEVVMLELLGLPVDEVCVRKGCCDGEK